MNLNELKSKIDKLIEEISYLKEAEELLKQVFRNVGVYNLDILDNEYDSKPLSEKIKNHFNFDDNE